MMGIVRTGAWLTGLLLVAQVLWAGEYRVAGPQRFERGNGKPVTSEFVFASPVRGGGFKLRIDNGETSGAGRVSSASVALNGTVLAGPSEFNQQVAQLQRTVALDASNRLSVQLNGQPGSYLTVSITGEDNDPPQVNITAPADGGSIAAATVDVLGTVIDATPVSVNVNGKTAIITGQSFNVAAVPLAYGENRLIASATDLGGNTATYSVTVTRPHPAPTVTLSAEPSHILSGESATLRWESTNADSVTIAPDIGMVAASGILSVSPSETTTYLVTATGPGGQITAAAQLVVEPSLPPPTVFICAKPSTVKSGGSTILSWSTSNADQVRIDPRIGLVGSQGSIKLSPKGTTTYTIIAEGAGGNATSSVIVTVEVQQNLPSASLTATPAVIVAGQASTLIWTTQNAELVTIEPSIGSVPLSGTLTVAPESTTTYILTAMGVGGLARSFATVQVASPPPTLTLSANTVSIGKGQSASLTWTSTDADLVTVQPGIGVVPVNGTISVSPDTTMVYTISANGPGGTAEASFTVYVSPQPVGSFGAEYQDLIPPDAAKSSYNPKRFALITGEVKNLQNEPIPDVTVSVNVNSCVQCHGLEYGSVKTDNIGRFTIPVEGGSTMTVVYQKPGLITSHRQVYVPWNGYAVADTAQMLPQDPVATIVTFDGNPQTLATHRSSSVSDEFGTRATTLVFTGDNRAYEVDAEGLVVRQLTSVVVRATEFITPESMPAALPPTSAYTYCVELSVEGAERVRFDKPVTAWVDNFLGFEVGGIVPVGYYDRDSGVWIPSDNGVVVLLLDTDGDGVVDAVDSDGDNLPNDLNGDGLFRDEVKGLEDSSRYRPGASFWRVTVNHFTPWDFNWPLMFPPDAIPPNPQGVPEVDEQLDEQQDCQTKVNSYVEDRSRIFHEDIPIVGTDLTLHYASNRTKGYKARITVPVSGNTVPGSLKRITVKMTVAGRVFSQTLSPAPNQKVDFIWDGIDGLGRPVIGSVKVRISIGFVYEYFYALPRSVKNSFGQAGTLMTIIPARIEYTSWKDFEKDVNGLTDNSSSRASGAKGWSFSNHHFMTPKVPDTLVKGDGEKIRLSTDRFITTVAGNSLSYGGDGGPAVQAMLQYPLGIAVDAAGNLYIADRLNFKVRKVDAEGIISTVAGIGSLNFGGDGGPAVNAYLGYIKGLALDAAGNLYIADSGNSRVRKVDVNGIITTVAGGKNLIAGNGDGGPAVQAKLINPSGVAVDSAGNLYIADAFDNRIRKVDTAGIITTVAGNGSWWGNGDGGPAVQASLNSPYGLTVDSAGNLYIAEYGDHRVRKVNAAGIITTIAGKDTWWGGSGDGGPAVQAKLYYPDGVAVDSAGDLYISDSGNHRIRKVNSAGIITTVTGVGSAGYGGDNGWAVEAKLNDPSGVAVDALGNLYIADSGNHRIRKVAPQSAFTKEGVVAGDFYFSEENGLGYIMSSLGLHKKTIDLDTGATLRTFGYDADSHLTTITDQYGDVTTINRDANGLPTSIVAPDGQTTRLAIDTDNHLTSVTYPNGGYYSFEYTLDGLMTTETDPNGNRFEHVFDSIGRLTDITDPELGYWKYIRTSFANGNNQVQKTTGEGNTTTYLDRTDSTGAYTTTITGPSGGVTTISRSADGLTETSALSCGMNVVGKYGLDSEYKYKFLKEQTESTPAGKSRLTLRDKTYLDTNADKSPDRITETVTVNGKATTLLTDTLAAKREATSPLGRKVTSFYDPANLLTQRLSVSGLQDVAYGYDSKGRLTSLTQGERQTAFAYDEHGFLASVTDAEQRTTSYDTDIMGRVTGIHRPDGSGIGFEYDHNGNMTVLSNPSSIAHGFTYDGNDKKTGYQTPQSGSYRYVYDKDRRLVETDFPSGRRLLNVYDKDRLARVVTPEGDVTLNYLCATKLGSMAKGGETLSYVYDGKLVTAETLAGTLNQTLTYAYNNDFNVTAMTYAGSTTSYVYDNDGLLTGSSGFTIARDTANGLPKTVSGGTFSLARSFNGYGEVAGETTAVGGASKYAYSLTRSPAGRITSRTETVGGTAINYAYGYDELGRLTSVTKNNAVVEEYRYDGVGRRSFEMNAARGIAGRSFAYSDEDHLLTAGDVAYQYDLDGFLTSKTDASGTTAYSYSSRGELLKVVQPDGKVIEFVHDPQGRRIAKKINGVVTEKYLWQGLTRLLAVYNGSNALVMRLAYADGRMPVAMTKGGATYYLGYDQVGSLRVVTDSTGSIVKQIDYDSFGNILADSNSTFTVLFGFAGGLHDRDINLVRFGYRDYDPVMGRWTAKDPVGFAGGDMDVWGYAQNNPVNRADPLGLWSFTFGGYVGPGFEISTGIDNSIPFLTGRIGLGFGGGFSWDPNGGIPGPTVNNPCEGGVVLAVSGAANFNAGPLSATFEKGDARNYSNNESSFYGGKGYSFGGEIGKSMAGISAGGSVGASLTLYGGL